MKRLNREIRFHVTRIILTLLFLLLTVYLIQDTNAVGIDATNYRSKNTALSLVELSDGIKLVDAYPVSDEIGSKNDGYVFKIVNNGEQSKEFKIEFINTVKDEARRLDSKFIRYQIIKNNEVLINAENIPSDGILFTDIVDDENTYELKLWIDYDATKEILGKYFSSKIAVI